MKESWHFMHDETRAPETIRGTAEEAKFRPPVKERYHGALQGPKLSKVCQAGKHIRCRTVQCVCACHKSGH